LETSVSFADWVKNGWLVAHKSSKQEIANLLGIVARNNYMLTIVILMSYRKSGQISSTALKAA
jgi:hypothetical protein